MEILTDADFDEKTKTGNWIIDFYADWCGPCRQMRPVFEKLASEYTGKVNFGKVNTDESPATAQKFRIMGIPTFKFLKDGQETGSLTGAVPEQGLREKIKAVFGV